MKRVQEYHIEHYWQTQALKRKKKAEFKEHILDKIIIGAFIALEMVIMWEMLRQLFEII
jgi:hypothetical protein